MSSKNVEKKKKRVSDQVTVLINYMDNHRSFAAGKFQDPHNGKRQSEAEWTELASVLNEMGPSKTVDQWRKCWRNEKCVARKINSAWKKCLNKTGNSSKDLPVEPSDRHKLILSIIGTETSEGIGSGEVGFGENIFETDVFMNENVTEGIEDLLEIVDVNEFNDSDGVNNPVRITEGIMGGKVKSAPKTILKGKTNKTDTYKMLVDDTNEALKNMTDAIKESTAQMASVVHAINNMSYNIQSLTKAITAFCPNNLLSNNKD